MTSHNIPIDSVALGDRVRVDLGDIEGLAESIRERGLLQPIAITPETVLIDGHRRIEACKLLKHTRIDVHVVDVDDLLLGERDANEQRKDFTPSEAVKIGRLIEDQLRGRGRQNQAAAAAVGRGERPAFVESTKAKVDRREVAAKAVGIAPSTYREAKRVVEAAEADPETFGDLPEQMDRTRNIHGAHREMERRREGGTATKKDVPPKHGSRLKKPPSPVLLERILSAMQAAAQAADGMDVEAMSLDAKEAAAFIRDLSNHLSTLRRLRDRLKEYHTNAA